MNRIVITGATSFIGTALIKEWLLEDCQIYAVVRKNSQKLDMLPKDDRISVVALDMENYEQLPAYIETADCFYHLAWHGTRGASRDDEQMQLHNYECALKAFYAAADLKCRFFFGAGSQAEYGKMSSAVSESSECNPETAYGRYKLCTCEALSALAEQNGMRFVWARIFSLYGENDFPGTLISSCIDKMLRNSDVDMTACTQLWDYLYIGDAARAMKHFALKSCESGIYNLASGDIRPLKDYVCEMKEILGSSSALNFGAVLYGKNGPVDLAPNIDKLLQTGWRPETGFGDGIKEILAGKEALR